MWIAAAHAVCAGVFLILARRAPVIEDEADLPFLEPHQVDRPSGGPGPNIPATLQRTELLPCPAGARSEQDAKKEGELASCKLGEVAACTRPEVQVMREDAVGHLSSDNRHKEQHVYGRQEPAHANTQYRVEKKRFHARP